MSPLDQKLLRDLWRMKGQAIAIALVIATGVMMLVMMSGVITSLEETRRAYYERNRLADIFAPVTRAPLSVIKHLSNLPGISVAEGRVTGSALINIPGLELPLRAQAVSLPDTGEPRLINIHLTSGRHLNHDNPDEVILLKSFARANELEPGDVISATMNGARRSFHVVGLAQSPEYLYSVAPGELISDDSRFGVLWMSQTALSAAYDMQGAFNEAVLAIGRDAKQKAIIEQIDLILDPYGGLGAYSVEDQISNRFVSEEINGLRTSNKVVPPIFLAVAAFLLNIVVSRMVQSEREQIGLIKAFGYTDLEVGLHYFKFTLAIAILGAAVGCLAGIALGRGMLDIYQTYFKFPILVFNLDPASFVTGILVSILSASAGGLFVLRRVFNLTPAVAMRPPTPVDYSISGKIGAFFNRFLDQPSRMILRRLTRQPVRMLGSLIGISCGMALSVSMISLLAGFDYTTDMSFSVINRSDATVTFTHPLSKKAIFELEQIPGILEAEPTRSVSTIFRHGTVTHRGGIEGLVLSPRLNRAMAKDLTSIEMRKEGLILSKALAAKLAIKPGEDLLVDVREGRRPTLIMPVVAISESLIGSPAYMHIDALNQALKEPNKVSAAYLRIDTNRAGDIFRTLKTSPTVAGVSLKTDARDALQKMMDTGAGSMRFVMVAIASIITFGIIYNSARIAFAERSRDLASLQVMGFTRGETSFVLLGEFGVITALALPLGAFTGYYLAFGFAAGFSTDLYQIPTQFTPSSYGIAALAVLGAATASGWLVKRDIDRIDLVAALKVRE